MAQQDKKLARKIIVEAAKEYRDKLLDRHFAIIYSVEEGYKCTYVGFRDMNFLHLTGVSTKLSAQQFFLACIDGKLSECDFEVDGRGTYLAKDQNIQEFLSQDVMKERVLCNFEKSNEE